MDELIEIFLKYAKNIYFRAIGIAFFVLILAAFYIGQHNLNKVQNAPNDQKYHEQGLFKK